MGASALGAGLTSEDPTAKAIRSWRSPARGRARAGLEYGRGAAGPPGTGAGVQVPLHRAVGAARGANELRARPTGTHYTASVSPGSATRAVPATRRRHASETRCAPVSGCTRSPSSWPELPRVRPVSSGLRAPRRPPGSPPAPPLRRERTDGGVPSVARAGALSRDATMLGDDRDGDGLAIRLDHGTEAGTGSASTVPPRPPPSARATADPAESAAASHGASTVMAAPLAPRSRQSSSRPRQPLQLPPRRAACSVRRGPGAVTRRAGQRDCHPVGTRRCGPHPARVRTGTDIPAEDSTRPLAGRGGGA